MLRDDFELLPYFDESQNGFVQEIKRLDAYIRRGGKLSAPQMLKYENRVAMLVERLILILEAIKEDTEALHDYLASLENNRKNGALPEQVYLKFNEKVKKQEEDHTFTSERERDRLRVIQGGVKQEESTLTDLPVEELLKMYQSQKLTPEVLYQQLSKRERAGMRLPKMDPNLWGKYRSWVAEKRRARRRPQDYER